MPDPNSPFWTSFWLALIGLITAVTAVLNQVAAAKAAARTERVRTDLHAANAARDTRLDEIQATGDAVHVLVNNSMSVVLKAHAEALRRLAELTGTPEDRHAAESARKASDIHEAKQRKLDQKGT